jgi:glutaredoxin
MIQVFQAEWCPFSHLVREKLTELGVDYIARQVEPDPPQRRRLVEATGQDTIPAVILEDGTVLAGDSDQIVEALEQRLTAWEHQDAHVRQAAAHGA